MANKQQTCQSTPCYLVYSFMLLPAFAGMAPAAVRNDFDGDGKSDPVLYEPLTGQWFVFLSGSDYALYSVAYSGTALAPIAADFDGDGKADPGWYDEYNAVLSVRLSTSGYELAAIPEFGGVGFTPVAADFDGDGLNQQGRCPAARGLNSFSGCFYRFRR